MEFQDRWSNVNQCIFIVLKINKDIRTLIVLHIIIFLLLMNFCSAMFPTYILQKLSNQIFDTHLPIYQSQKINERSNFLFVVANSDFFCYDCSHPHLKFWIFCILENFGLLLAKFLALTFSEGFKKLAYSFKWYIWA